MDCEYNKMGNAYTNYAHCTLIRHNIKRTCLTLCRSPSSCQNSSDASMQALHITSEHVLWSLSVRLQQQIFKVCEMRPRALCFSPSYLHPNLIPGHISDGLGIGPVLSFSFLYIRHLSVKVMEKMSCVGGNNETMLRWLSRLANTVIRVHTSSEHGFSSAGRVIKERMTGLKLGLPPTKE